MSEPTELKPNYIFYLITNRIEAVIRKQAAEYLVANGLAVIVSDQAIAAVLNGELI